MKRPSDIIIPEVEFGIIPPKGFLAITWFGRIIINKKNREYWKKHPDYLKNITIKHEKIHIMQAERTHNSWFCFYCKYIWFWLKAMFLCKFKNSIAYYCNPFEIEAFLHENDRFYNIYLHEVYQKIPVAVYVKLFKKSKNFSVFIKNIRIYAMKETA